MTNTNIVSEVKKKHKKTTMARFDPPPKFSYKADEWEEWLADFDEYRITAKVDKEEGNVQISSLLYSMGAKKAREMYNILKYGKVRVPRADGRGT